MKLYLMSHITLLEAVGSNIKYCPIIMTFSESLCSLIVHTNFIFNFISLKNAFNQNPFLLIVMFLIYFLIILCAIINKNTTVSISMLQSRSFLKVYSSLAVNSKSNRMSIKPLPLTIYVINIINQ